MVEDIRPIIFRSARSILSSSLIASAAVALTVALVAFPASREASAQGFRLPGVSKNSAGGKAIFLKRGKSNKFPAWSQGGSRRGKGLVAATGSGGSGKGTGGSGRGSSAGGSGQGGGKGGHGDGGGRRPGGKNPTPPPIISGGGAGIIVGVATPGGPPNLGGSSNPGTPGNQVTRRPGSGVPPTNERNYVPDEVVIELAADTTDQAAQALAQRFNLQRLDTFDFQLAGTKVFRWRISDRRSVPTVVRALEASGSVISVSPNYIMRLHGEHTVAVREQPPLQQYALTKLQVPQAHTLARGNRVLIAIIDGGVDASHPELAGAIVETFDAIGSGDAVHAHGTAVAGAIAAQARLKGTAPAAQILAARAFGARKDTSEGTSFHVVKAINWAVTRGARIINMSFAGPRDPKIELSLKAARLQGVILVAAAGNAGPRSQPLYPAADPNVIAVTATDEEDRLFSAANRGSHIAVAAPGVELWLPGLNGTYQETSGTSFAAAEVSGTVALMIERKPGLTHDEVRRTLMSTARDLGPRGIDPQFGAGLVDAYRAVLSIAPPVDASAGSAGQARN